MSKIIDVALVGHTSSDLDLLANSISNDDGLKLNKVLLPQGVNDPLANIIQDVDVIVLSLAENWREVLSNVSSQTKQAKAAVILIGPDGNTEMMRLAMKAGVRDFLTQPISGADLVTEIRQLAAEQPAMPVVAQGSLCVFISVKGGAGASAIATHTAHAIRYRDEDARVVAMDLDLQYGQLPLYFDQSSDTKLTRALASDERIDHTLLDACLFRTDDGVDVLASRSEQVFSAWETSPQAIDTLLNVVCGRYDHIIVDVPRQIDPISFQALERASRVCVVMQQTLSDLCQAQQVVSLLRDQGIANEKIMIVVNRHETRNTVRSTDIADAFDGLLVQTIPNDHKRMASATGNGEPLPFGRRKPPIVKAITALADELWPPTRIVQRGFFGHRTVMELSS